MIDRTSSLSSCSLPEAFDRQDEQFTTAFSTLQKAIADRAFPGASIAVTHGGRLVALKSFGHFTYSRPEDQDSETPARARSSSPGAPFLASFARTGDSRSGNPPVHPTTLFDVASLTKVVATTPIAMLLYDRGLLDLDAPVSAIVPEFLSDSLKDSRRRNVSLQMLLAHSSGLPAYEKLFLKAKTRDELLHAAFTTPLVADPATRAVYSDIGFIILGIALERLADESLDRFCQREIFAQLAMTGTTFNPPAELHPQVPPTADERKDSCGADTPVRQMPAAKPLPSASQHAARSTFRNKIIQGEVQDENAYVLGGVAAHAGLFSTASDLARFAQCMLNVGKSIFRPETIALFTSRQSLPAGTSRALGWDTPSNPSQSGKYFSPNSFGHLGYTGTSLWIDPVRQLSITLLTNRTWPDCANQDIKQVRPKFYDAVIEALAQSM